MRDKMGSYLDKKGIKFVDERLNCAFNTIAVTSKGRRSLDFIMKNLTSDAIEAINSNQYINEIPVKNGYTLMTCITNYSSSSYLNTHRVIEFKKDNILYSYSFKLSYFHDKCYISDVIGTYYEAKLTIDENGKEKEETIDGSYFDYEIVSYDDTSFFKREGIYVVNGDGINLFTPRVNIELDALLGDMRTLLKSRKFYRELDKETTRLYYPGFYGYYNDGNKQFCYKLENDLADIYDSCFDKRNEKDGSFYERVGYMSDCGRELQSLSLGSFVSYDDWCLENNVEEDEPIDYKDWVKNKDNIVKVDISNIEKVPSAKVEVKEDNVYKVYNPYRSRYEEDEEEVISNDKKGR